MRFDNKNNITDSLETNSEEKDVKERLLDSGPLIQTHKEMLSAGIEDRLIK